MKTILIEGNKGGNYFKITQLDDNKVEIEVGDCCVHTAHLIVTAEVLSNFLTTVHVKENKSLLEVMKDNLSWDNKSNEEFSKECKSFI